MAARAVQYGGYGGGPSALKESQEKSLAVPTTSQVLDTELWRACAGRTVSVLTQNYHVCYFPQGHAENANCSDELAASLGLPPFLPCRVAAVKLEVEKDTDEVFERITLVPLRAWEENKHLEDGGEGSSVVVDVPSYAKKLMESDVYGSAGFVMPRLCVATIFPGFDYNTDPPVQTLLLRDFHGVESEFRHKCRPTPGKHMLTSGWKAFVDKKQLLATDSILFVKKSNGEIGVGIRRRQRSERQSRPEEFTKAVTAAASGDKFEVLFYPARGPPSSA